MALTIKQVRTDAHNLIIKDMRYRMHPKDIDPLLDAAVFDRPLDVEEVSREAIVAQYLREHVRKYSRQEVAAIKKMMLVEETLKGKDPYSGEAIAHFLPEAIKVLQDVEKVGTAINPKIAILKAHNDNPILSDIFMLAYDWHMAYGIGESFKVDMEPKGGGIKAACHNWSLFVTALKGFSKKPAVNNDDRFELRGYMDKMPRQVRKWAYRVVMRDLKIGIKVGNSRRVWKNLLPRFDVSLCSTVKKNDNISEALDILPDRLWVEPKYDGLRCVVLVTDAKKNEGNVYLRSGIIQDHLHYVALEACAMLRAHGLNSGAIDAEGKHAENTNYSDATSVMTTVNMENRPLHVMVFDMVSIADFEFGTGTISQEDRRADLEKMFSTLTDEAPSFKLAPGKSIGLKDRTKRIMLCYSKWRGMGFEGLVIKDKDSTYAAGERNRKKSGYFRIKPFETIDVKVTGWYYGKKGTKYEKILGGFVCQLKNEVDIRVGGGFSDKNRQDFYDKRNELIGRTIEIQRQQHTPGIKSRHSFFKRLRVKGDK